MKSKILLLVLMLLVPILGQQIKVTTLIENTCVVDRDDLVSQHGVSMHIKFGNTNILFDTGVSDNFIKNANKLGIDISDVDILVISHAHMDHGGGLNYFLAKNSKAKIYMHENVKKEYYYNDHYIGLDLKLLSEHKSRITYVKECSEILPNISLLTSFGNEYLRPKNSNLFMKDEDGIHPDNMAHEIVLVMKREEGLVILSGCSHNGILNMTDAALKQFPDYPILAVLGGFHLANPGTGKMAESEETVKNIAEIFQKLPVEKIYTGHCTGDEAFNVLKEVLGNKLSPFRTGTVFEL